VKSPEKYIDEMHLTVPDLVEPGKPARIDANQRIWIGHDIFYFADAQAKATFAANPFRYAMRLTDPVTLERFPAGPGSPKMIYDGRPYFFAASNTFARFKAHPDSFAIRRGM
jgi:YHS domain-containing protein